MGEPPKSSQTEENGEGAENGTEKWGEVSQELGRLGRWGSPDLEKWGLIPSVLRFF